MIIKPARVTPGSASELAVLHLDRQFEAAADWVVLHGLRVSVGRHLLHLDHLLINDFLECVCIDSRYLTRGLSLEANGRFQVSSPAGSVRIDSPLVKATREARLMAPLVERRRSRRQSVRRRLRLGPRVSVQALVLHDPAALTDRQRATLPGSGPLAGTVALHELLQRQRRRRQRHPFERVPATVLREMALVLAHRHQPVEGEVTAALPALHGRMSIAF